MSADPQQALSFGTVADSYDQTRPGPPAAALDYLVPPGCEVAVDLGAGTGLFTRALLGRVPRVIAVEPDERMRAVLAAATPQAQVRAGRGEELPLPDDSVDAVFASTAWHWFDGPAAVAEVARVLRPGGRLGVIWTSRDRGHDWVAELDRLRRGIDDPRTLDEVRADVDAEHTLTLPDDSPFGPAELRSFWFSRTMPVSAATEWMSTSSSVIVAEAERRAAGLARCREVLLARAIPGEDGSGEPLVELPCRSRAYRADLL